MAGARPTGSRLHLRYEDVTVGWICALVIELQTARSMLDDEYKLPAQKDGDPNTYVVGRIGKHKIAMVCLDSPDDPSSATSTAVQLLRSFPCIRCGLMVGIGGGVTCWEQDVRLGDVVVGHPKGLSGGVVAFEAGKAVDGATELRGHCNSAPDCLRSAANTLESEKGLKRYKNRIVTIMEEASNALIDPAWPPPDDRSDILRCSKAIHDSRHDMSTCPLKCDPVTKEASRPPRSDRVPRAHRGLIASSHKVIADERQRDDVVEEMYNKFKYKILCFEMEAFGLANKFPCLVVRGISDYADSTKNDEWQRYAAFSAAAYAKELLLELLPTAADLEESLLEHSTALSQHDLDDGLYERSAMGLLHDRQDLSGTQQASIVGDNYLNDKTTSDRHNLESNGDQGSQLDEGDPTMQESVSGSLEQPNQGTVAWNSRRRSVVYSAAQQESLTIEGRQREYREYTESGGYGRTAMHIAAHNGDTEVVDRLQQLGQDVGIKDNYGRTPMHFAAGEGQKAIFDHLQQLGQDISVKDNKGHSPMHYAALRGQKAMVDHLQQLGQSVGVKDNKGWTPMHHAAEEGQDEMVDLLKQLERARNPKRSMATRA